MTPTSKNQTQRNRSTTRNDKGEISKLFEGNYRLRNDRVDDLTDALIDFTIKTKVTTPDYHANHIRLSSSPKVPPPPPPPPPPPRRPPPLQRSSSACSTERRGNDGHIQPTSTTNPITTSFMSDQWNEKKRLHIIHHYSEPSPPILSSHKHDFASPSTAGRDRGRQRERSSHRGQGIPVSADKSLANSESQQADHQEHQVQRLLAKGVAALSAFHARSLSRQRSFSIDRIVLSRRASSGSDQGRQRPHSSWGDSDFQHAEDQKQHVQRMQQEHHIFSASSSFHPRSLSRQRASHAVTVVSSKGARLAQQIKSLASGGIENEGFLGDPEQTHAISPHKGKSIVSEQKFDLNTGRCKKHPSIILAKKSAFRKGWDVIKVECPRCGEARKHQRRHDKSGGGAADQNLKLNKGNNSMKDSNDDINPDSVAATSTTFETDMSDKSGKVEAPPRRPNGSINHLVDDSVTATKDTESLYVTRMPYTTPWGEIGWYSGKVNSRGTPNGKGRMRTKTGNVIEGMWSNGYSDDEKLERRSGKMKSGFHPKESSFVDNQRYGAGSAVRSAPVTFASPGVLPNLGIWSSNQSPGGNNHYQTCIQSHPLNGVQQHQERLTYSFREKPKACSSPGQTTVVDMTTNHSPGGNYPFSPFRSSKNQQHQAQMQYPAQEERMMHPSQALQSMLSYDVNNQMNK